MSTPRKFTFEKSRETAEQILLAYEGGITPKELADHFDITTVNVWAKIKQARKWRSRNEHSETN